MYKLLFLSCVLFPQLLTAAEPVREIDYRGASLALKAGAPTIDHGYAAVYDQEKANIYAPDGSFAFTYVAPYGGLTVNVAIDADGTIAAAMDHVPSDHGVGIAVVDRTGALKTYISTAPYSPSHVCFAPDHSIWAIGRMRIRQAKDSADYFVLRHYSRDGRKLGAFLPRSSLDKDEVAEPAEVYVGASFLRATDTRLGAYLHFGGRGNRTWTEFSLDGKEQGRWKLPDGFDGLVHAFTRSGQVYASGLNGLFVLDHSTGKWNPVPPPSEGILLSADGDDLVFWLPEQGRMRYVPVNQ